MRRPSCTHQIVHESVVPELRLRPFLEEPLRIGIVLLGYWSHGHPAAMIMEGNDGPEGKALYLDEVPDAAGGSRIMFSATKTVNSWEDIPCLD